MTFLRSIPSTQPDDELVVLYRSSGDKELLANLYQRYMDLVYGVCLKYMKDTEEAKDCVLSIFEELVTKLRKHQVSYFKGWLYQLSKNHCLMKLRQKKSRPYHTDTDAVQLADNSHPEAAWEKEQNLTLMEYCMEQLGDIQRNAIDLFYLKQKCYREISITTGIELSKVRSHIQNGRRNLKICMEKQAAEKIK